MRLFGMGLATGVIGMVINQLVGMAFSSGIIGAVIGSVLFVGAHAFNLGINALGAYVDDCRVEVFGNAQDATGDTMNAGEIIIHGSSGDATGYAMRGGMILVEGNVGYRAGIHMKAYKDQVPVLVVGGEAGSFLGEYQAGGYVVVLGLNTTGRAPVGRFCAAGMHGGKIFLRTEAELPFDLPSQVSAHRADAKELEEIRPFVEKYAHAFGRNAAEILRGAFQVLIPNTANPYKSLYVTN